MHSKKIFVSAAIAVLLSACGKSPSTETDAEPKASGRLIIVGGALKDDNEEIFGRMVALAGPGTVAILPTASGVAEESTRNTTQRFERWGGRTELVDIQHDRPEEAANPERAEQMRSMAGLFFLGGVQTRVLRAFRPDAGDTVGYTATWDVLRAGGFIGGTSAGAALMCDPMIEGGTSRAALQHGVTTEDDADRGVRIGRGMGYFPYGLADQHFLMRGRTGRLIVALEHTGEKRGYGVEENRAIDANLATHQIEAIGGPHAVLLIDISEATREGSKRTNIRLSLLGSGDLVDGRTGTITPVSDYIAVKQSIQDTVSITPAEDAWGRLVIPKLMEEIIRKGASSGEALDPGHRLVFSQDKETRAWRRTAAEDAPLSIANMRLDILPKE